MSSRTWISGGGVRAVAAAAAASALVVAGAASAQAQDIKSGYRSCKSSEDVVSKGDSTAGSQIHFHTNESTNNYREFPYKAYRHGDYGNVGYSTSWWRTVARDYASFYSASSYCVN